MSFEQIKDLLPKAIDRSGDPEGLLAAQALALWPLVVKKVMSPQWQDKSSAKKLSAGQLTVVVASPVVAQEFKLHFPQLLKEMNRQARRSIVKQIFFRLR